MDQIPKACTTLPILFMLTTLFDLTLSAPDFTQFSCSNNIGNYTKNSRYQTNLNTLLSSLSSNVNPYGFYNSSVGEDPDRAHALVLCGGDASFQDCETCVNDSTNKIIQLCPNQKEAIGWYTICMIRYSNRYFFGNMSTRPSFNLQSSVVPPDLQKFNQKLSNLSNDLRDQTVGATTSAFKFAAGKSKINDGGNNITIYALMQCTPDLTSADCNLCLGWTLQVLQQCCYGTDGARVIGPSSNFWYEVFPIYNERVILSRPPPSPLPPSLAPPPPKPSPKGKHGKKTIIIPIICVISGVALGIIILCIFFRNRRKEEEFEELDEGEGVKAMQYDFGEINAATNDFSSANLLGKGGFGAVYKGTLSDGKVIAVKRLAKGSGQGDQEFRNEVLLVAKLQHKSLVRLLGFSLKKEERLLIDEFLPNGSLDKFLFESRKKSMLNWDHRYRIIESVAKGLLYLHENSRLKIIHRDLKASNIFLDEDMNAKISDFGMAKLFQFDESVAQTNRVVGTYGYMAPEYALRGICSDKADVFSFGVLVLEIISGQKNRYVQHGQNVEDLLSYVWKNWLKGTASNIIDSTLKATGSSQSIQSTMIRCIHIGLLCVQDEVASRPSMSSVVFMLHGNSTSLPMPCEPAYFTPSTTVASRDREQLLEDIKTRGSNQIQPIGNATNYSLNEASISELDPR